MVQKWSFKTQIRSYFFASNLRVSSQSLKIRPKLLSMALPTIEPPSCHRTPVSLAFFLHMHQAQPLPEGFGTCSSCCLESARGRLLLSVSSHQEGPSSERPAPNTITSLAPSPLPLPSCATSHEGTSHPEALLGLARLIPRCSAYESQGLSLTQLDHAGHVQGTLMQSVPID